MEGVLVIDQHDRNLVNIGDQVELMFDAAKLESFYGKIVSFSQSEMKETSASLSTQTGGSLDTKTDESGRTLPMSTSYQAKVHFDEQDVPVRGGYRGKANIHLAWKSLGWRLYRYAVKTFNFEF
jgi:putative peptide zinc metalloprotease protein